MARAVQRLPSVKKNFIELLIFPAQHSNMRARGQCGYAYPMTTASVCRSSHSSTGRNTTHAASNQMPPSFAASAWSRIQSARCCGVRSLTSWRSAGMSTSLSTCKVHAGDGCSMRWFSMQRRMKGGTFAASCQNENRFGGMWYIRICFVAKYNAGGARHTNVQKRFSLQKRNLAGHRTGFHRLDPQSGKFQPCSPQTNNSTIWWSESEDAGHSLHAFHRNLQHAAHPEINESDP